MTNFLLRAYWGIERVMAPGLRYAQYPYEETLRELITPSTEWLDIGCGHHVLPEWRFDAERELVNRASYVAGIDPDSAAVGKHRTIKNILVGDARSLPFPDNRFSLITANMVVEHLEDPGHSFAEIRRVLAPGGVFLFHTPNVKGYIISVNKYLSNGLKKLAARVLEGRSAEDVYPTFYRCNTEKAILETAAASGLEVKRIDYIPSTATFALIFPIAAVELLWIRATMSKSLSHHRTNILGLLYKRN
jgi:ubiquinone/menaquinone biosynthesis C-methylase UbiE